VHADVPALVGRRACAAIAVASAVLHGLSLGQSGNTASAVLLVAMILVCLNCARLLWARGALRDWSLVAAMNLAMIAVHWSAPEHQRGAGTAITMQHSTVMTLATALAGVEAALAVAVLCYRTRPAADPDRAALIGI
jgi:NADH:ubiquinone oxidoreductase subunit K